MSNDKAIAENIARWLDGQHNIALPEEAQVTIFAIRPDLAPNTTVSIDDVLSRVQRGPFVKGVQDQQRDENNVEFSAQEDVDFVEAIFKNVENHENLQSNMKIEDILSQIQRGPFAQKKEAQIFQIASKMTKTVEVNEDVARPFAALSPKQEQIVKKSWWRNPMLTMSLAVAMVLFVLLPSNFQMSSEPQSSIAMDQNAEEMEKLAEDFDDESTDSMNIEQSAPSRKPKVSSKPPPKVSAKAPSKPDVASATNQKSSKTIDHPKSTAPKAVTSKKVKQVEDFDNSLQVQTLPFEEIQSAEHQYSQSPKISETPEAEEEMFESTARLDEIATEDVFNEASMAVAEMDASTNDRSENMNSSGINSSMDDVSLDMAPMVAQSTTIATESSTSRNLKNGFLSKDRASSEASVEAKNARVKQETRAATMSEPDNDLLQKEKSSLMDVPVLPILLSDSEMENISTLETVQEIQFLCDKTNPTKALEILWHGHKHLQMNQKLELLLKSEQYANADRRYLQRNYLIIGNLYFQLGDLSKAEEYWDLAK